MENSSAFFSNKSCRYFPCHEIERVNEFSCLFCYCPLYTYENCGGNYSMENGIKNCSSCILPHRPKGYDYINDFLRKLNTRLKK